MAKKKKSALELDLEHADLMTIISGGGQSKVFSKNELVDYSYPTGIVLFDYAYGYEVIVRDENDTVIKKRILHDEEGYLIICGRPYHLDGECPNRPKEGLQRGH